MLFTIEKQVENALKSKCLPCTPALVTALARICKSIIQIEKNKMRSLKDQNVAKREQIKQKLANQGNRTE